MTWTIETGEPAVEWVAGRLGASFPKGAAALVLARGGERVGGAVFCGFTGRDVEASVAATATLAWPRAFLARVGLYVFGELGCARMTVLTSTTNARVMRLAPRLGAVREGVKRNYYGDGADAVVFGILKEDWPHGLRSVTAARARSEGDGGGPDADEQGNRDHPVWAERDQPGDARRLPDLSPDRQLGRRHAAL
ncbi:GNAT family N-acetyltransferase [Phreatobacter sp. AB_2022a]|uniref:GNAT family N-acetyltransferase n=1 Tax=Phreatobacter sp. AB_2022a TaxID=3003134 RepID=UPI002287527B|nr:GNAT family protein [Phreatobacter sp. AB_2022a]MCZ0734413.1 GNAT family protein [Phreatobacter sp. AB_2022a]